MSVKGIAKHRDGHEPEPLHPASVLPITKTHRFQVHAWRDNEYVTRYCSDRHAADSHKESLRASGWRVLELQ